MKRAFIALILLVVFISVVKFLSKFPQEDFFNASLETAIRSEETNGNLADLTDFHWDEVCYFPPYSGLTNEHEGYQITGDIPNSQDNSKWFLLFKDSVSKRAYAVQPIAWPKHANFICSKSRNVQFELIYPSADTPNDVVRILLSVNGD